MSDEHAPTPVVQLPEEPVDRLVKPIMHFLQIEAASGVVLLGAALSALLLANSFLAEPFFAFWSTPVGIQLGPLSLAYPLKHVINEGLMTLFFFVVGLEIKREWVVGELREPRVAALPAAAALGGMIVPAAVYLAMHWGEGGERGWGIVMATDIAFVVGCLAILGERVPHSLRIFVLSLAIIDDIGAVIVIAFVYSAELDPQALALAIFGIAAIIGMRRIGVRSVPVFFIAGIVAWLAFDNSGIHPTILGVVLGLLTPAYPWVAPRRFEKIIGRVSFYLRGAGWQRGQEPKAEQIDMLRSVAFAARETISPLERLMPMLHPWVSFLILPLFAFANAGVPISTAGLRHPVVPAVIAGLVLGKPIGIFAVSWLAVRLGIAKRPEDLRWPIVAAAGVLCGIGFTMALFIANLAFEDEGPLVAASLGILAASLVSAILGLVLIAVTLHHERARQHRSRRKRRSRADDFIHG